MFSQHALVIFDELESDHGRAHTHNHLGMFCIRRQRWADAEHHLHVACSLWEKHNDDHSLIYGYENLGLLYIDRDLPEKALAFLKQAEVRQLITYPV